MHRKWAIALMAIALMMGVAALTGCGGEDASDGNTVRKNPPIPAPANPSASPGTSTSSTTSPPATPLTAAKARSPEELVAAGRAVYMANCIACHNMNPREDGALGPAVAGSSTALLEARVLRGEYPEGHTPARTSKIMVPLPHLEPKLPELAAYLASAN